jgi:Amt family ammonium transporter
MSLIVEGVDLDALNYTIKVPYNGSIMTGGDSLNANLNVFYDVSAPEALPELELNKS